MGNKLSCSCAPLIKKGYRYEDSPWQANARGRANGSGAGGERRGETGHLLRCGSLRERKRLWAEVFHVTSGSGSVKWQQVSEDLVPVSITCIQDSPETIFHITAYNCQVDKILDVRLVQPGTRIGQASECFVYWKDTMTSDTWGLNFTCPIDAKQFKECVSPSFKISRKASSSYSLRLEPLNKQTKVKTRQKPLSTPASPSRSRELQCTCMTPEQFNRLRQDPRCRPTCANSSTLPRIATRSADPEMSGREKMTATSSASLYDNVNSGGGTGTVTKGLKSTDSIKLKDKQQQSETCQTTPKTVNVAIGTSTVGSQIDAVEDKGIGPSPKKPSKQDASSGQPSDCLKSEGTQAGGSLKCHRRDQLQHTKSADYSELEAQTRGFSQGGRRSKSKSTDDMRAGGGQEQQGLRRSLKPVSSIDSPLTSPEMTRKRHSHHSYYCQPGPGPGSKYSGLEPDGYAHTYRQPYPGKFQSSRSVHEMDRQYSAHMQPKPSGKKREARKQLAEKSAAAARARTTSDSLHVANCLSFVGGRGRMYLDLERNRCTGDLSPPSDNVIFDNQCYATTPSSSNGNSDMEQPQSHCQARRCNGSAAYQHQHPHHHHQQQQQQQQQQPGMHSVSTPGSPTSRLLLEYEMHLRNTLAKGMDAESYSLHTFEALLSQSMENLGSSSSKSSTLPLSYRYYNERQNSKDRDGYYSDRNEIMREKREREIDRDRGYLSDYNSRCASCIGESARAQWFRHSDGWQSGSSTLGSAASSSAPGYTGMHKRDSPWDSLPSLRHEGSLNDSGYKSNRTDSLEQRGIFDRQDSVRSDYMSDRESRYGIVQQASLESTDSRLCYLTSSEHLIRSDSYKRFCEADFSCIFQRLRRVKFRGEERVGDYFQVAEPEVAVQH
ncbi:PREDICTED: protein still life, isoform SIF type 1-like [Ceratosolen solmsi marchali]|uniref:Protein still life, isoform SIF type 1-like n=1 Tax=Ceratosolen solmsi marchali TaxID=326594 RepID=A0AAJ7E1T4_9HYME|nr:PREDICTED: protein still life, isoform SIF type 1-like [Ceratosolen solmsi marchali]